MSTTYPSQKQTFTDPSGTSPLSTGPDHAQLHTNINDTVEALQDTAGTTAGTNILKDFAAGQFPVRINSSGVIAHTLTGGTINTTVLGTPSVTGGTIVSSVINTPTIGTPTLTLGSDAQGDMFYRSSGGALSRLAVGSSGQYITSNGTTPSWGSASVSAGTTTAKAKATLGSAQNTGSASSNTKVQLNTEIFDPGNNFDNATNYRFTAPVTGYYAVNGAVHLNQGTAGDVNHRVVIYKNSSEHTSGNNAVNTTFPALIVTDVIQLNATDYVELYIATSGAAAASAMITDRTFMSIHLLST